MKMKTLTAVAMVALLCTISANATVVFNDVFDGGEAGAGDLNQNLIARQAAGTISSTYTFTGTNSAFAEISGGALLSSVPNPAAHDYALVDLDTDFGASLAGNVWSVHYDGSFTNSGVGSFGGWTGIFIGNTRGFGADFGVFFRPDGGYSVFQGFDQVGAGYSLPGFGDYSVEVTFNEVQNSVSIFHMSSSGGTNHLGSYAQTFSGGSRYVHFRSHVDSATAGAIPDSYLDNLTIETLPTPPSQEYVFLDSFDTGDTTDVNANLKSRQAGGGRLSGYVEGSNFSISGNKLLLSGGSGSLRSVSSFADQVVGNDFIFSFKLTKGASETDWLGIYLLAANEPGWVEAKFGVRCSGVGDPWAFWVHDLSGVVGIGEEEISGILGYTYDKTQEHVIELVSTAGVDGTNSYAFVVDGVVIRDNLLYAHTEDTSRRIYMFSFGSSTGHIIDDLGIKLIQGVTYADWVAEDTGLTEGVNDARTDDPDLDGMDNLLEYVLGGDPLVDDAASILPTSDFAVDTVEYVYRRRVDAALRGLDYGLLVNINDLQLGNAWTNYGHAFETDAGSIDFEFESVTNVLPITGIDKGFLNLEVMEN